MRYINICIQYVDFEKTLGRNVRCHACNINIPATPKSNKDLRHRPSCVISPNHPPGLFGDRDTAQDRG